jgi:hypothetical protein
MRRQPKYFQPHQWENLAGSTNPQPLPASDMTKQNLILIFLFFALTSCEGFKSLTLYNKTNEDIIVTTRLDTLSYKSYQISNTPDYNNLNASKTTVKPDNSFILSTTFTSTIFNSRLKGNDLIINYLKIQTPIEVIEAKNKKEIIKLIRNKKTKYRAKLDKKTITLNTSNFRNIVIRN